VKEKEYFKFCVATRDFEITQLVSRNNFFMIFQGVLFAGLAQSGNDMPPLVAFVICAVGVVSSLFQAGMASGAKWWQERWEMAVNIAEKQLILKNTTATDGEEHFPISPLFSEMPGSEVDDRLRKEKNFAKIFLVKRFSVSSIPIYTGYFFLIAWILLLSYTMDLRCGICIVGFPK